MKRETTARPSPSRDAVIGIAALAGVLLGTTIGPAAATTIEQTSMTTMVERAQLIFQGRVVSSAAGQSQGGPTTCFVFAIEDTLKGAPGTDKVRLCFLGGKRGKFQLRVTDLIFPKVGEQGIYFVASLSRSQANPLYGWSQGHFLVRQFEGAATVTTADGRDVIAVTGDSPKAQGGISKGVAAGLTVRAAAQNAVGGAAPLSVTDFKASIRRLLTRVGK